MVGVMVEQDSHAQRRQPALPDIDGMERFQPRQNPGAIGWSLTPEQIARLDAASAVSAPYPHFPSRRQEGFARRNPPLL
jgi:hypothetical protein